MIFVDSVFMSVRMILSWEGDNLLGFFFLGNELTIY